MHAVPVNGGQIAALRPSPERQRGAHASASRIPVLVTPIIYYPFPIANLLGHGAFASCTPLAPWVTSAVGLHCRRLISAPLPALPRRAPRSEPGIDAQAWLSPVRGRHSLSCPAQSSNWQPVITLPGVRPRN
jgi:hypothetical protein